MVDDRPDFENKVVLVTGASRGIGRAAAQLFADRGARVGLHFNRGESSAQKTLSSLPGGPHSLFGCDLSKLDNSKSLLDDVLKEFGRIDVLVNNAGIYEPHGSVADIDYKVWRENWDRTLGINLLGPADLMFWTAKKMIAQGGGRIVNVSSRGAFRGEPDTPAYGASKAGLNALSQSLAQALAPHNIYVTVVAPGYVETDMTINALSGPKGDAIRDQSPLGRVATPEEIAGTVVFLASEGTKYLTGAIVDVNGASYLRS
jgi:NAD(P)-dependent dehydrogenase (short-subunit alcohol dehydrogenase family)